MSTSILIALKDSITSRSAANYVSDLPFRREDTRITLLHVFRKPSSSENFMGTDLLETEQPRAESFLNETREKLIENGYVPDMVEVRLVTETYPTVSDGILDQCETGDYDMIVIGRKRMSKAEEFVMGDISIKLVRALQGVGVLVVEPK